MTREEAIKTLHELWRETNDPWYEEVYNMAIEALTYQNLSKPNNTCEGDLIRRRDAIEAVRLATVETRSIGRGDILYILYSIPSAEQVTGKLKNPCDSLLKTDSEACKEQKSKSELISRQDAIDAIMGEPTDAHYPSWYAQRIKLLPSPEPKTGKWVLDPNGMDWNIHAWRCSECGFVATHIGVEPNGLGNNPMNWAGSKFCPQCGARITGYER